MFTTDNEEIIRELTEVSTRAKSNTKRLDKLEAYQDELKSLATSVAVMAQRLGSVEESLNAVNLTVGGLRDKSGKRWDSLVDKIVWLIAGGLIAYMLALAGIQV